MGRARRRRGRGQKKTDATTLWTEIIGGKIGTSKSQSFAKTNLAISSARSWKCFHVKIQAALNNGSNSVAIIQLRGFGPATHTDIWSTGPWMVGKTPVTRSFKVNLPTWPADCGPNDPFMIIDHLCDTGASTAEVRYLCWFKFILGPEEVSPNCPKKLMFGFNEVEPCVGRCQCHLVSVRSGSPYEEVEGGATPPMGE